MIRVTHPHHPLYNQIVKVLRKAGNPVYPEPCYLIELPDGTRAELPLSWAEATVAPSAPPEPAGDLWAGIPEYLTLAAVLHALCSSAAEEEMDENRNQPTNERAPGAAGRPGAGQPAPMGRPARKQSPGADPGPGGPAAARPGPASPAGGAP